ncbi:MAG: bifunctional hydroxymethylpyrimidine kinase/phosphomethylpyrimidine kinase [Verrucomicrobia bacterium]|nr:MAG: bifunctional hydroxymethylpyrimidine kinase/phosphomethylpyrimidine kinase [Verrucomicrobiota bacterium]
MAANPEVPVGLTIAGSDSSAGAGIQADLKTFSALGVYGLTAITGVVAETPGHVSEIEPVSVKMVSAQIEVLLKSFPVAAIKTGLLFSGEIVSAVAKALRSRTRETAAPLVIDPVMVATSGASLLQGDAVGAYEQELFPLAALITPNLDEAARLLGEPIGDLPTMRAAGKKLAERYRVPVLLKGGHLSGQEAIDLLFVEGNVVEFSAPFSRGIATHGTGCTYSAAITAGLANRLSLEESVRRAKKFVTAAIAQHFSWQSGAKTLHALNHCRRAGRARLCRAVIVSRLD